MNDPYERLVALERLLDSENPDIHVEILLVYGPIPSEAWRRYIWISDVHEHLVKRYSWKLTGTELYRAARIIHHRIEKEMRRGRDD